MKPLKKNCCDTIDTSGLIVTGQLIREHQLLESQVFQFCQDLRDCNWSDANTFLVYHKDIFIPKHFGKEEQLYLQLAKHLDIYDQKLPHLLEEHREDRDMTEQVLDALKKGNEKLVCKLGKIMAQELADHAHDENKNAFPLAERLLTPDQVAEVLKQMKRVGNLV